MTCDCSFQSRLRPAETGCLINGTGDSGVVLAEDKKD